MEFRTRESYRALIAEIREQFEFFSRAGYTFSMWQGEGQPYRSSREMRADVRTRRHLYIYPSSGLPPDHPLAPRAMPGWAWNDMFRAVHDIVGHAATGFQFGPVGEENAFRFHATIHSAAAVSALAAEICIAGALHDDEYIGKLVKAGFSSVSIEPTRVYNIEDARQFLTGEGIEVDAIAPLVENKIMSAFIRAVKPAPKECCDPACCS